MYGAILAILHLASLHIPLKYTYMYSMCKIFTRWVRLQGADMISCCQGWFILVTMPLLSASEVSLQVCTDLYVVCISSKRLRSLCRHNKKYELPPCFVFFRGISAPSLTWSIVSTTIYSFYYSGNQQLFSSLINLSINWLLFHLWNVRKQWKLPITIVKNLWRLQMTNSPKSKEIHSFFVHQRIPLLTKCLFFFMYFS